MQCAVLDGTADLPSGTGLWLWVKDLNGNYWLQRRISPDSMHNWVARNVPLGGPDPHVVQSFDIYLTVFPPELNDFFASSSYLSTGFWSKAFPPTAMVASHLLVTRVATPNSESC
jgi:hypothetical protein